MKFLLFGTGKIYQGNKHWFSHHEIVALLDNDSKKQGQCLDGVNILSPEQGICMDYDAIFLMSLQVDDMKKQLQSLGVREDVIFTYHDIRNGLEKELRIYGELSNAVGKNEERIVFLTDNLHTTGAQVVFLDAAKALKRNGFEITVATPTDGPIRQAYLAENMPVIVDGWLQIGCLNCIPWLEKMNPIAIFVNTACMNHLLACSPIKYSVVWWLHESEAIYRWISCKCLDEEYQDNIHVYAASPLARKPFLQRWPLWPVGSLSYGLEEIPVNNRNFSHKKVIFAMIGAIEERKAQQVFLEAVSMMPEQERQACEFWLIYQHLVESPYVDGVRDRAKCIPEVKMLGERDHSEMPEIYQKIDVLVCPSLSDTLPVVTLEAMQNSIPCIVTDGTGTASYVRDYENGFVCPMGDAESLADRMCWMIHHPNRLADMGKAARNTYENNFTMEIFEKNLMEIVRKDILEKQHGRSGMNE